MIKLIVVDINEQTILLKLSKNAEFKTFKFVKGACIVDDVIIHQFNAKGQYLYSIDKTKVGE